MRCLPSSPIAGFAWDSLPGSCRPGSTKVSPSRGKFIAPVSRIPPDVQSRLVAPFFVVLWGTGFIAARYGVPYAEPSTFLALRFGLVLVVMVPAVAAMRSRITWPVPGQIVHIAIAGVLLQAAYLLGVFEAVRHGMGAGLVALVVGLQPILTAVAGSLVRERIVARQWTGLLLGLVGVALVVRDRLSLSGVTGTGMMFALAALAGITAGTLYQKRFCPRFDLRAGSVIQFTAAFMVTAPIAMWTEPGETDWTWPLIGAMLWSVLVMSIGAISLLFILIRRGAATQVASLMYLTPAVTALMAWMLFDERITPVMVAGMVATALGVASANAAARHGDQAPRSSEVVSRQVTEGAIARSPRRPDETLR